MPLLPRPPVTDDKRQWQQWFEAVYRLLGKAIGIPWGAVDKTGSKLSDIETRPHSQLQSIEGTGTRHITAAENSEITALDALSTGVVAKTGNAAYSVRTITGTTDEIVVTYGDGVSGNPTIGLSGVATNQRRVGHKNSTATLTSTEQVILGSGTFSIYLPTAVGIEGKFYNIKNVGTGTVTVDANASETIDGALTVPLYPYEAITVISDNATWWII